MSALIAKYKRLLDAYSDENLNHISGRIIELYKHKNYDSIFEIANKVSLYHPINEDLPSRCFSKLIKLYHPDKGGQYRQEIIDIIDSERFSRLKEYRHIESFDINEFVIKIPELVEDADYHPEYIYDVGSDDLSYSEDYDESNSVNDHSSVIYSEDFEHSFYNVLKLRMYGHLEVEIPPHYLQDHEYIEMTDHDLEYLDGIKFCIHARKVNLSRNQLSDITELVYLKRIEELDLSDNDIGYIDALAHLVNLRRLDISFNQVEDLSPIFDLEFLNYINIEGNDIPEDQIANLQELGVVVLT